ncbi:hypothetical protein BDM02DRAFT_3266326 [Thelephora ganbajun]|uniref:Uncharacterized protein n=1 Tax=Thelephora ganbajun TaxID=370292 RepID=A0ACB6ZSK1_THEGA|nr:hypothetical protein BDM02DRAFT_3266326 [Thelephora ganbajun]
MAGIMSRHKYEAAAHSTVVLTTIPFLMPARSASPASPPPSPRISSSRLSLYNISQAFIRIRRLRQRGQIVSTSGPEPITHPCLFDAVSRRKVSVSRGDQFVCVSAVDVPKLLRACRLALLDQARTIGANVLVEEQWCVSIIPPKNRADGPYKVQVRYSASAARSDRHDPGRPVALDQSKGVPGLMTILKRTE